MYKVSLYYHFDEILYDLMFKLRQCDGVTVL